MGKNNFAGLRSQKGAALLIMFLALFMVSAAVLLKGLGSRNPSLRQNINLVTDLASAKEALLADAAMDNNPGHFPCPDTNNDGLAEATCGANTLGRLPVKFNRDFVTDQQLWYALTDAYHGTVINSTTSGALRLDGQNDIVAVIMAPGQALTGQTRPNNTVANYLEAGPVSGVNYTTCSTPDTCNDTIQVVHRKELMSLITPRVAGEIKTELDSYHTAHSEYPADQAAFLTALATAEPWIAANNWQNSSVTTYARINTNTATLQFADCASTFTLTFGSNIARSQNSCQ
jgi:hypothetical protein